MFVSLRTNKSYKIDWAVSCKAKGQEVKHFLLPYVGVLSLKRRDMDMMGGPRCGPYPLCG